MKTENIAVPATNDLKKEESTINMELTPTSETVVTKIETKPKVELETQDAPPAAAAPTATPVIPELPITEPEVVKLEKAKTPEAPTIEPTPPPQAEEKTLIEPEKAKTPTENPPTTSSPENKESKPTITPIETVPNPIQTAIVTPPDVQAQAPPKPEQPLPVPPTAAAVPPNQIPPPSHAGESTYFQSHFFRMRFETKLKEK